VQALNDGQPSVSFETRHRIKNGKLIPVQVRLSNIIYGGRPARLATMTELTEKRSSSQTVASGSKDTGIGEQTPLGAEVHSNLKEALSTTKLYLDVAAGNSEMQEEMIRLSRENIGGALKELRLLERTGTITGDFNLLRSLDDLINNHQRRSSFQINLAGSDIEELPDDIKITVFRLIEQALDQSSKAGASRAAVDIQNTDAVSVAITDNRKRNAEIISDPGSAAIRNRVAFYNGKLESGPIPEGYRLFVELPSKPV